MKHNYNFLYINSRFIGKYAFIYGVINSFNVTPLVSFHVAPLQRQIYSFAVLPHITIRAFFSDKAIKFCTKDTRLRIDGLLKSGQFIASVFSCVKVSTEFCSRSTFQKSTQLLSNHRAKKNYDSESTEMGIRQEEDLEYPQNVSSAIYEKEDHYTACELCSLLPAQVSCEVALQGEFLVIYR